MKKLLLLLLSVLFIGKYSQAQIALAYDDTLICRGATITMGASVTGQVNNLTTDDDFTGIIPIGFPFTFFGNTYTQCLINDNNFISFDLTKAGLSSGYTYTGAFSGQIPAGELDNAIMLAHMDLYLTVGGSLQYQTFGSPGSRRFVVEFCNVPKYGCTSSRITNQVILYEGSNIIEIHTTEIPPSPAGTTCPSTNGTGTGGNGVQGLRYVNGTTINEVFTPGRAPADFWGLAGAQNTSRRFTPTAAAPYYTVDSIAYDPWHIIQSVNSNLLTWYDANGNFLHQGASLTTTVSNPPSPAPSTFYVVEYTGQAGCNNAQSYTFRDTITVNFSDIKTYRTESMCAGTTYDFYGRTLYSPGTYDTTFLSQIGCDSTIILTLNINPLPEAVISNGPKAKICQGDRFIYSAQRGVGYTYQWTKENNPIPGATSDTFAATEAGTYRVVVTSDKGCKKTSDPSVLTIAPNPTVKINYLSSNEICAMDTVTLHANATGENLEYIWAPDEYFWRTPGHSKQAEVKAIVSQSGYISVRVVNNDLCSTTDSIFVSAEPCCEMPMPNAFTPNNDGKNDFFIPKLEIGQTIIFFQVFNRYGQLVYESNKADIVGWNGKDLNGNDVAQGVYMYALKYACSDKKNYEKKGDVTLMR